MAQYEFNPRAAELGFGFDENDLPAWELQLDGGHGVRLRGFIDRVDVGALPGGKEALAVVIDYKSGAKELKRAYLAHGLQLQLAAYLSALRRLPDAREIFGVARLIPAGMFYVNLRGQAGKSDTRDEALENRGASGRTAFDHRGRFDAEWLARLDNSGAAEGSQFKFKLRKDGNPHANSSDALSRADFLKLLDQVEANIRRMGGEIYAGQIHPNPFQKGQERACDQCDFASVCRFDPWTAQVRSLECAR